MIDEQSLFYSFVLFFLFVCVLFYVSNFKPNHRVFLYEPIETDANAKSIERSE